MTTKNIALGGVLFSILSHPDLSQWERGLMISLLAVVAEAVKRVALEMETKNNGKQNHRQYRESRQERDN